MNFECTPAAFHWWMFSLFWKATGRGGGGVEFVGPGSSQLVDAARRFYWSLVNFSQFLYLIGMVLESTASKLLAYF